MKPKPPEPPENVRLQSWQFGVIAVVLYVILCGIGWHAYRDHQLRETVRIQNKYRETLPRDDVVLCIHRLDNGSLRVESCPRGVKVK